MTTKTSVRTIYGALVQSALRWNDPLKILPNSTLNQKFDVLPDSLPYDGEKVYTKYLAIGLKGITIELNQGLYKVNFRNYLPSNASLFKHCPFIMRRLTEDLTPSERARYRMRKIEEFNGVSYACYYLRVIDNDGVAADAEKRQTINGLVTPDSWEPTLNDLNPNPDVIDPNQQVANGDEYLAASKKIKIVFTPDDIQELIAAVTIIYGDPGFAELSEFGLVSGVDRQTTGDFGGVSQAYTEAVYAQVNDFLRARVSAPDNLGGKILNLDAGSVEPLLLTSNN